MEGITPHNEKGLDPAVVFGTNSHLAFVYKKTERLVTAVYMITNLIKDNEPLKWKIRESALSLMAVNLEWDGSSLSERRDLAHEYRALALDIVSLSSVGYHAGLISEMNFTVLAREFNSLVSVMNADMLHSSGGQSVVLDPGFFDVPEPQKPEIRKETQAAPSLRTEHIQKDIVPFAHKPVQKPPQKTEKDFSSKEDRRAIIIKLLGKKSRLSVKDFTDSITGVSEKTIQRELLALVAEGTLKKEGERRWSTYSLASVAF